jgi:hypothetical protein
VRHISTEAARYRDSAHGLLRQLQEHAKPLDLTIDVGRLRTAQIAVDLLDGLHSRASTVEVIDHLATADLAGPADRCGASIKSAATNTQALELMDWKTLSLVERVPSEHKRAAQEILDELQAVARADELTSRIKLAAALATARRKASDLLERVLDDERRKDERDKDERRKVPRDGDEIIEFPKLPPTLVTHPAVTAANLDEVLDGLRGVVEANPTKTFKVTWQEVE